MIILVNIEPEPISAEFTKCSVYDRQQDLSTEALSGVRNYDALQLKRMIDGRQAAQHDITDESLSLFHSVVGIVWVVHSVLVRAKVIAVDKTQFGKPLLNFTKKG
jgi:predicted RNA-binding protein with PUA-like domain